MTRMLRKQIYLPKRQQAQLRRLAKAHGISEAEIVRQAFAREVLLPAARPMAGGHAALEEFIRFGSPRRAIGDTFGRG